MLKATEIQGRRYYKTPNGNVYPSVTTVVGYPKEQFFKEWRARVSKHERTYGASRGTSLHNIVESHLAGEVIDVKNPIHKELFEKLLPRRRRPGKLLVLSRRSTNFGKAGVTDLSWTACSKDLSKVNRHSAAK